MKSEIFQVQFPNELNWFQMNQIKFDLGKVFLGQSL